jgi:hypothetical protein
METFTQEKEPKKTPASLPGLKVRSGLRGGCTCADGCDCPDGWSEARCDDNCPPGTVA